MTCVYFTYICLFYLSIYYLYKIVIESLNMFIFSLKFIYSMHRLLSEIFKNSVSKGPTNRLNASSFSNVSTQSYGRYTGGWEGSE